MRQIKLIVKEDFTWGQRKYRKNLNVLTYTFSDEYFVFNDEANAFDHFYERNVWEHFRKDLSFKDEEKFDMFKRLILEYETNARVIELLEDKNTECVMGVCQHDYNNIRLELTPEYNHIYIDALKKRNEDIQKTING